MASEKVAVVAWQGRDARARPSNNRMKLTGREGGSRRRSGLAPKSFARCLFALAASRVAARSLCGCSTDLTGRARGRAGRIRHT